jgi:serine/threonine protein kinase/Tol biopolymer transport system component
MGEVYRARDPRLNRVVALKILPPQVAGDPGRRQRFEQEARAASALNHPNIVAVYDVGQQDGLSYIVSELIEGESLRDVIERGPMPLSKLVDLFGQIASALAAAHAAGIVHRDLKPENIMVTRDGRPKILDFGLAKQLAAAGASGAASGDTRTQTSAGVAVGTAAYMSPEQVRGDAAVDNRSDIFSFGVVLYECVAGKLPFERPTSVEIMTAILREDPVELPETVSPALRQIVWHCLEKEPESRFHSARDLGFALRTVTANSSRPSSSSAPALPVPAAPPQRASKWIWRGFAAVGGALLAGIAIPHLLEREPIELANYKLTPFATDQEPESDAAWSTDGKSIAYVKRIGGVAQLMVRGLDAPSPVQLTRSQVDVTHAFWSPDSTLLYFVSQFEELNHEGAVSEISPAGGQARRLFTGLSSAAISPDGKTLAIWRGDGDEHGKVRVHVALSSPPGAEFHAYTPEPFTSAELAWWNRLSFSPDGKWILLAAGDNSTEFWLLPFPAGGAAPHRIFAKTDLGAGARASWMPDSRHAVISFGGGLGSTPSLWMADLPAETMRRITAPTSGHEQPSLSPDGARVAFTSVSDDYDLLTLPLDGGAPTHVTANSRNEMSPSISPDGQQIVYSTDRSGPREIWMRNVKAGIDRPVVTARDFPPGTTTALADPVFSPDGSRFAFARYSTNEPVEVWFEPSVGGAPIRLAPEQIQGHAWSPDGNSIAGRVRRDNPWQPAIVGVGAEMTAHLIPDAPACFTPLDWSPTGEWLACESFNRTALFSPDGKQKRSLPFVNASAVAFSSDGKWLYAVGKENGISFLKALDVNNAAVVKTIATYGPAMTISGGSEFHTRLSRAPGGKSLATSAMMRRSDIWLLEGFPLPRPWWRFWR